MCFILVDKAHAENPREKNTTICYYFYLRSFLIAWMEFHSLPPTSEVAVINIFNCVCLSVYREGFLTGPCPLYRAPALVPFLYKARALHRASAPSPPSVYRTLVPLDMFKLVQLGPHCTGTSLPPDMLKLVHFEAGKMSSCSLVCHQSLLTVTEQTERRGLFLSPISASTNLRTLNTIF